MCIDTCRHSLSRGRSAYRVANCALSPWGGTFFSPELDFFLTPVANCAFSPWRLTFSPWGESYLHYFAQCDANSHQELEGGRRLRLTT